MHLVLQLLDVDAQANLEIRRNSFALTVQEHLETGLRLLRM